MDGSGRTHLKRERSTVPVVDRRVRMTSYCGVVSLYSLTPFPFGCVTVVIGPDRIEQFRAVTDHFLVHGAPLDDDVPFAALSRRIIEPLSDAATFDAIRSCLRLGFVDEMAFSQVPGQESAAMMVEAADTGHAVVCVLDVPDLDAARSYFAEASGRPLDHVRVVGLAESAEIGTFQQNDAQARADAYAAKKAAEVFVGEDIAGQIARMPEQRGLIESLVLPYARMTPAGVPESSIDSYVGGYPFVPEGTPVEEVWPVDEAGAPMAFMCQINFADIPAGLDGYPTTGMLQWFVGGDGGDSYGLYGPGSDDEAPGLSGLHARWYTAQDLTQPSLAAPFMPTPPNEGPLTVTTATRVQFTLEQGLPSLNDIYEADAGAKKELKAALDAHEDNFDGDDGAHHPDNKYGGGLDLGNPNLFGAGDRVGGHPFLVQGDPREGHPERAHTVLIQFDSEVGEFTMWGDEGTGQLFGDPQALAEGDLSSLWWGMSCY